MVDLLMFAMLWLLCGTVPVVSYRQGMKRDPIAGVTFIALGPLAIIFMAAVMLEEGLKK